MRRFAFFKKLGDGRVLKNMLIDIFPQPIALASSAGSSEDECREEDLDEDAEDEVFPLVSKRFRWMASKGAHGRLHLCDGDSLACLRTLKMPDDGVGLDAALATQKSWSPRCWAALGPAAKAWWSKAHCEES